MGQRCWGWATRGWTGAREGARDSGLRLPLLSKAVAGGSMGCWGGRFTRYPCARLRGDHHWAQRVHQACSTCCQVHWTCVLSKSQVQNRPVTRLLNGLGPSAPSSWPCQMGRNSPGAPRAREALGLEPAQSPTRGPRLESKLPMPCL